ncbi:MAG: NifB/NifX family molybdenum-iron cluster-binding protein [Candidatus Micrarchaeota archaeon]
MKICIPSEDEKTVSGELFEKAKYFVIFTIRGNTIVARKSIRNEPPDTPYGLRMQILKKITGCTTIICKNMCIRMYKLLQKKGIKVIITDEKSALDAAENFIASKFIEGNGISFMK